MDHEDASPLHLICVGDDNDLQLQQMGDIYS